MPRKDDNSHNRESPDLRIQRLIANHQEIADNLRNGVSETETRETLAPLTSLPEESQISLLKGLAKEKTVQAASIAAALQTCTDLKQVRKEAHRTLIKLESAAIYPTWQANPAPSLSLVVEQFAGQDSYEEDEDRDTPRSFSSNLGNDLDNFRSMLMGRSVETVVSNFLEALLSGSYTEAYNLLASMSPLREGLSRSRWISRRKQWAKQAQPHTFKIGFIQERDDETDTIVDIGWSLAFKGDRENIELPELPQPTLAYAESRRYWFWSSYKLILEDGKQRIAEMQDEGTQAKLLPIEELKPRLDKITVLAAERYTQLEKEAKQLKEEDDDEELDNDFIDQDLDEEILNLVTQEDEDEGEASNLALEFQEMKDMMQHIQEAFNLTTQALHYSDALMVQAPTSDVALYQKAIEQAGVTLDYERAAAYAELLAKHFPAERGTALSKLGNALLQISTLFEGDDDEEQAEHYIDLSEKALREAVTTYKNADSAIQLAQLLIRKNHDLDESEALLHEISSFPLDQLQQASRSYGLGIIAELRDQASEALHHFQQVADIAPDSLEIWMHIGTNQLKLNLVDEAEQSLLRSLEQEDEPEETYIALAMLYLEQRQNKDAAAETIEEGLETYPESANLHAAQALFYLAEGKRQDALASLDEAEDYDPDASIVRIARERIKKRPKK